MNPVRDQQQEPTGGELDLLSGIPQRKSAGGGQLHVGFEKVGKESPFLAIRIHLKYTTPNLTFHDMMC